MGEGLFTGWQEGSKDQGRQRKGLGTELRGGRKRPRDRQLGRNPTPKIMLSSHPRATLMMTGPGLLGEWALLGSAGRPLPPLPKVAPPPPQSVGIGPVAGRGTYLLDWESGDREMGSWMEGGWGGQGKPRSQKDRREKRSERWWPEVGPEGAPRRGRLREGAG